MRCFLTFTIAAALAVGWNATTWSQTSGGGGASGSSGTASGTSGASSATGTGSPGASGNVGAGNTVPGASGNAAAGTVNGANSGVVGPNVATGNSGNVGTNPNGAGATNNANNRANANGINNRANAPGINNRANAPGQFNRANLNNSRASMDNGISQTPFFSDPGARRQLNLNDNQFNSLNRAYQNAYTRYNQAVNDLDPNMSAQQRELAMQQLQSQFNQNLTGTVNSTLRNPQAQNRFNQLNRQFNGFNAFNDPTVRRELNLSQDQIRQLRSLSANWRHEMQQLRREGTNGQTPTDPAQWTQMQQQYATQLSGVLTPQQQQQWSQMTGQAYAFPQNAYLGNEQPGDQTLNDLQIRNQQQPVPHASTVTPQGNQTPATTPQRGATPSTAKGGATQGTQGGTVR